MSVSTTRIADSPSAHIHFPKVRAFFPRGIPGPRLKVECSEDGPGWEKTP
jgi:hypothetical protein